MVSENAKHVKSEGKTNIDGIEITGVTSFHDDCKGAKRGKMLFSIQDRWN